VKIGSEPQRVVYLSPKTHADEIPIIVGDFDWSKNFVDDPGLTSDYHRYMDVTPRGYIRSEVNQFVQDVRSGRLPISSQGNIFEPVIRHRAMRRLFRLAQGKQTQQ